MSRGFVAALLLTALPRVAAACRSQIGLVAAFKADKFVLRKASSFDDQIGKEWVASEKIPMTGSGAWLTYFVKNAEDTELDIELDGNSQTVPLAELDANLCSKNSALVKKIEVGGMPMALVQVPQHFKDVWNTFHDKAKVVLLEKDPDNWEKGLDTAWRKAWDDWDHEKVYTLLFADGLGKSETTRRIEVVFQEEDGTEKASLREAAEDILWLSTSVPLSGQGSSSFRVRVDSAETEAKKLDGVPSYHSVRCVDLKSKNGDEALRVFVAAFSSKEAFDLFKKDVGGKIDGLWDPSTREWLFEALTSVCSSRQPLHEGSAAELPPSSDSEPDPALSPSSDAKRDSPLPSEESSASSQAQPLASPVKFSDNDREAEIWSRYSSVEDDEARSSRLVFIIGGVAAAAVALAICLCLLCRGGSRNASEASTDDSFMDGPDIHGTDWEVDRCRVGGGNGQFAVEREESLRDDTSTS